MFDYSWNVNFNTAVLIQILREKNNSCTTYGLTGPVLKFWSSSSSFRLFFLLNQTAQCSVQVVLIRYGFIWTGSSVANFYFPFSPLVMQELRAG